MFFITSVVVLFVSTGDQAQFGSDFAVVGLVHAFLLFGLIVMFGVVSGGHFNPAVTLAALAIKRISPIDARDLHARPALGRRARRAALPRACCSTRAAPPTTARPTVSGLLGGNFRGSIVEAIGTFCLVLVILAAVYSKKSFKEWAPLAIGTTLGFIVMVGGPLTGGSFNPARWFGPALVGNEWGGVWPYLRRPDRRLAARGRGLQVRARGRRPAADRAAGAGQAAGSEADADQAARRAEREPATDSTAPPPGRRRRPGVRGCSSLRGVRRVTFSRNYTLSLSRTCQCYCKYCAFATHQAHIHAPEEVETLLDEALQAQRQGAAGPHRRAARGQPGRRRQAGRVGPRGLHLLRRLGLRAGAGAGHAARTRTSASSSREDLARLREVTASQGLMLESISERLMETVHAGSPTKHPAQRLATIEAAGELKIPFTSGILVGIGETEEERVESLEALAELHERHGHLQEVILQNFVPHPRYYGAEVADIADEASRERWAGDGDPLRSIDSGAVRGSCSRRRCPVVPAGMGDAGRRSRTSSA